MNGFLVGGVLVFVCGLGEFGVMIMLVGNIVGKIRMFFLVIYFVVVSGDWCLVN